MSALWQDVRYGMRMLAKNPGFTAVAVLTLALGIGANTAIFSVVNAVLLRPLPYKDPDRLVMVFETEPQLSRAPVTPPDYFDWTEQNQVFESMAAGTQGLGSLTGVGEPEHLEFGPVSANVFEMLSARPLVGRLFRPDEDQPGHNFVVILSHQLWERKFGSHPTVVGRNINIEGSLFEVIGLMPVDFRFPPIWGNRPKFWIPLGLKRDETLRGSHMLWVMGRLKPGATMEKASTEMETIAKRLAKEHPETHANIGVNLVPLREYLTAHVGHTLLVLFGAVGFVLLIACTNVAHTFLARATAREKEIALRTALGASRLRIVRQLLTESVLFSALGAFGGVLFAVWAKDFVLSLGPGDYLSRLGEISVNLRVLAFTLVISLLTGIAFGLVPSLQASDIRLNESLKEGGRSLAAGTRGRRFRNVLVVAEVALAFVLLICAGLLVRSLRALLQVNPGFDVKNLLTMKMELPGRRYGKHEQQARFYQELVEQVNALPGVQAAAATSQLPLEGGNNGYILIEGRPREPAFTGPLVQPTSITLGYFRTIGIRLLRGRHFTSADNPQAPTVAIINDKLARQFWPDDDSLGKRLSLSDRVPIWREVVGIVSDVHQWGLAQEPIAEAYTPYAQESEPGMSLVVRSEIDPARLTEAIRAKVSELERDLPLFEISTMEQVVARSAGESRFQAALMGIFGLLALALSSIGIYGVISYSVEQRIHEIGIRMALGAERREVLQLIVGHAIVLTLAGVALGLAGAFALTHFVAGMLYAVRPTDPLTFVSVSLLLAGVAVLASNVPARRATKVDPIVALRYQ